MQMPADRTRVSLSVVIAASDSAAAVERCLSSLGCSLPGMEIIVAFSPDRIAVPISRAGVTWIEAEPAASVPRLRRIGLDQSRGEVVVFTEDSCTFADGWADAWRRAFAAPEIRAATGPVAPAMGGRTIDWAVFFCEYAPFLAPDSPPARLAGNNFAIRRCDAKRLDSERIEESEVPSQIDTFGGITTVTGAVARHVRGYSVAEAVRDRLRLGRDFGQRRAGTMLPVLRWIGIIAGPLILAAQVARLFWIVIRARRHLGPFAEAVPITLGLLTAWSVGEWLGWIAALFRPLASYMRHETTVQTRGRATSPSASPRSRYRRVRPIA